MAHGEGAVLCDLAPAFFPSPIVLTAPRQPLCPTWLAFFLTWMPALLPLATGPLHMLFSSPGMLPLLLPSLLQLPQEAGSRRPTWVMPPPLFLLRSLPAILNLSV